MKKTEEIGIMLAMGYTKKEIAAKTGKSVNTIDNQAQELYRRNDCRNLADITRKLIQRYSGIPVEDILINAIHDSLLLAGIAFGIWAALQPEILNSVKAAFSEVFKLSLF